MKILFDQREFNVDDENKNIVEVAEENGVFIQAPCFRNHREKGCCKACLIKVDGKELYACETKPYEGMKIEYDTDELKKKREERLREYAKAIENGEKPECGCSSESNNKSGGCGCGCSCNH